MYINIKTKEYPVWESDIRGAFPNVSFPNTFVPPPEYILVENTQPPEYDPIISTIQESSPSETEDGYIQQWVIVDLPEEQVKQNKNNKILAEINVLESKQTPRRIREAALGADNGWLANLEEQIQVLREQLITE